jgi:hypothetical protein
MADGAEIWTQVDAVPVTTVTGTVDLIVAALADVTRLLNDGDQSPPSTLFA